MNYLEFIDKYIKSSNPATGSAFDSNANITQKTVSTLEVEIHKKTNIQINRDLMCKKLFELYGKETAKQYIKDLESHIIYTHDETSLKPYCASISLYPFLLEGTKGIGGVSGAPKNLQSFCGSFINYVYQVASNFAGAVATVEFLMYFDYFARRQYGNDYLQTNKREVIQEFQGVVYALNQPASARGDQSVFWNISLFDKGFFKGIFGDFYFPDGTQPTYTSLAKLQEVFMEFFREERKKELLTFPVVTATVLYSIDDKNNVMPDDMLFVELLTTEMSKGHTFFVYSSSSVDSLASCCRLRNELVDNTFSYSLGAGGVSTGSIDVITLNVFKLLELEVKLQCKIKDIQKYLYAYRCIMKEYIDSGLLPVYSSGAMDIDKQFLTIGLNGVLEGFETFISGEPFEMMHLDMYKHFVNEMLQEINRLNKEAHMSFGCRFNTEFVPAENLGVKNATIWETTPNVSGRQCYNSYFFPVEDTSLNIMDKLLLHSTDFTKYLDGGSACHLNLDRVPTQQEAYYILMMSLKFGVNYWTYNCLVTCCNDCDYINPDTKKECTECHSTNIQYATRVIGYLKRISNFSDGRQKEAGYRAYKDI